MSSLLLGVDIGASNIKIVELKEKKDGYTVKNMFVIKTPDKSVIDGAILDHGAVAKALNDSLSGVKGLQKESAVALKGGGVVVKSIAVPWNGKGNFHEEFIWRCEQYIGMKSETSSLDVQLLKYDMETQSAFIVAAAASKDKVADILTTVTQGGLSPMVVDIEALALVNLVTVLKGASKHCNIIIDMGHDAVRLIFYENGHVDSVKTIYKGGKYLIEEIAQDMETDPQKAEEMLRDRQRVADDADLLAATMAYGTNLGSEIETAIDLFVQERGKEPVDFYACGAVAHLGETLENIETSIGVSITLVDPFRYIELPDQFKPLAESHGAGTFAAAAGLAMRKA
jgi:type IV pilus assembly protein PilM